MPKPKPTARLQPGPRKQFPVSRQIRLTTEQDKRLVALSRKSDTPLNVLVRDAVDEYLERRDAVD